MPLKWISITVHNPFFGRLKIFWIIWRNWIEIKIKSWAKCKKEFQIAETIAFFTHWLKYLVASNWYPLMNEAFCFLYPVNLCNFRIWVICGMFCGINSGVDWHCVASLTVAKALVSSQLKVLVVCLLLNKCHNTINKRPAARSATMPCISAAAYHRGGKQIKIVHPTKSHYHIQYLFACVY